MRRPARGICDSTRPLPASPSPIALATRVRRGGAGDAWRGAGALVEGARASAQRRHQTPGAQRARLALAHKMLRGGLMLPPVIELHHADGLARILRKTFFLISNVYLLTFFLVLLEILWGKMNWRKGRIQVSFLICFSKRTQEKNVNFNLENLCEWCYSTGELTERCVSVVFTTASPTGHITSGTSRS